MASIRSNRVPPMNTSTIPTQPKPDRLAYPVADACYALGISRSSLYEMIARAELKAIKIAGRTLIPRSPPISRRLSG
jgi:excisionase family DNA binding protein